MTVGFSCQFSSSQGSAVHMPLGVNLSPGCLCLQGTFITLSFSRAQFNSSLMCTCFWELIPTVCTNLGHVLVLHIPLVLVGGEEMLVFLGDWVGIAGSGGYANLLPYFFSLILLYNWDFWFLWGFYRRICYTNIKLYWTQSRQVRDGHSFSSSPHFYVKFCFSMLS